MVGPISTVGGYGNPTINPDGAAVVDPENGIPVVGPAINTVTGNLSAAIISPTVASNTGIPVLNAILVELRRIANLLEANSGVGLVEDAEIMRANELYNITVGTGVI